MDGELFAGTPVRDRDVAQRWYEALLGAPPAFFPDDREAVWRLGQGRWLYVEVRPDHAGHARHTVFVEDLESRLAEIAGRGLRPAEVERYDSGVSKAVFRDPDGNELGVAGTPGPVRPPFPPAVGLGEGDLLLEPLTVEAAEEMVAVLAAPELYERTGGAPPALDELRARYARQVAGPDRDGEAWRNWVVREQGRAVGYVQATLSREGERVQADVAWLVGVAAQGRGVATAAAQLLVDHLRRHGTGTVRALVAEGHAASEAVARGAGLRLTGEVVAGERVWALDGLRAGDQDAAAPGASSR